MVKKFKLIILAMLVFMVGAPGIARIYGAPGTPGVPQAPVVLYEEDFKNRAANSNILLTGYTGTSGMTYGADAYWIDRSACNGFIVNYDSPYQAPDCDNNPLSPSGVYNNMLSLVYALGVHNSAADPETFPAVSAYTEGAGPANAIQFQTNSKIPLPSGSNFVSFSVDVSAVNCNLPIQPLLRFYLVDQSNNATPISAAPINPCIDPGSSDLTVPNPNGGTSVVRVGTFAAAGATLFSGSELGIVMRNEEGQGSGNDSAYTNIRVLNVSPQLDKSFAQKAGGYTPGEAIPVTFTITNTTDLGAKAGWSFTDNLPAGLVVANTPAVSNTCASSTVNAVAKASSFTVNGSLNAGQASCQVTLNLVAARSGMYGNGPANLSVVGLSQPSQATVTVSEGLADTGSNSGMIAATGMVLFVGSATAVWLGRRRNVH